MSPNVLGFRGTKERKKIMDVKILGISASPRVGNTLIMVHEAMKSAEAIGGVKTELFSFKGKKISPCIDCDRCPVSSDQLCAIKDSMAELYPKLAEADGLILGSPVYFGTINGQLKCMIDRCRPLVRKGQLLQHKVGGGIAVGACRSGGQDNAIKDIIYFLMLVGVYPVGLMKQIQIGAMGLAWRPGAIIDDKWDSRHLGREVTGLEEAQELGRRVAVCAKLVKTGLQSFDPSQYNEELGIDRGKIPDLKEARQKMREIEKRFMIEYS
jgi:multimeric flavodoxin WrbA